MSSVIEKVDEAREIFDIEDFPGNFFELKSFNRYLLDHKILVFKEDIGKLSGFIGYGKNDYSAICINYNRNIGHQNFTFAHEIGHWMMHKGIAYTDNDKQLYSSKDRIEKEANKFAKEILYPEKKMADDCLYMDRHNLLTQDKRKELAEFIDKLCHKYYMSYDAVLTNILMKKNMYNQKDKIKREIVQALGKNWSDYFQKDFYVVDHSKKDYCSSDSPYRYLDDMINYLVGNKEIGIATAESIKFRNGLLKK